MKKMMSGLFVLTLLAAGCAKAQLKKAPDWGKAGEAAAIDAKAGRYHASMDRMMTVAQYMFETEGFLFGRRDDDVKSFKSEIWKDPATGEEHFVELLFTQEEGGIVSSKWIHYKIVDFKDVDQCLEKAECQAELNDDWNWRLYKNLR